MGFPTNIDELRDSGYTHEGLAKCKGCGADIEWWATPRGKKIPMDHGTATAHWSTCKNASDFRKEQPQSTITTATLNMDWLKDQAKTCHCVVCKKITGRM